MYLKFRCIEVDKHDGTTSAKVTLKIENADTLGRDAGGALQYVTTDPGLHDHFEVGKLYAASFSPVSE